MIIEHPNRLIVIAVILMVFGVVMPFLMVIRVVESTFFMNFLSFGASMLGLFLGVAGIANSRLAQMHKNDDEENRYR